MRKTVTIEVDRFELFAILKNESPLAENEQAFINRGVWLKTQKTWNWDMIDCFSVEQIKDLLLDVRGANQFTESNKAVKTRSY